MSDLTLCDIDFKNKMALVWPTLNSTQKVVKLIVHLVDLDIEMQTQDVHPQTLKYIHRVEPVSKPEKIVQLYSINLSNGGIDQPSIARYRLSLTDAQLLSVILFITLNWMLTTDIFNLPMLLTWNRPPVSLFNPVMGSFHRFYNSVIAYRIFSRFWTVLPTVGISSSIFEQYKHFIHRYLTARYEDLVRGIAPERYYHEVLSWGYYIGYKM